MIRKKNKLTPQQTHIRVFKNDKVLFKRFVNKIKSKKNIGFISEAQAFRMLLKRGVKR